MGYYLNVDIYEKLLWELLSLNDNYVVQIFQEQIIISKRDSFYGGELFIRIGENKTYEVCIADKDINLELDKTLERDIPSFKDAVRKLNKHIDELY